MRHGKASLVLRRVVVGFAIVSTVSHAKEIGGRLDCHIGAHDFIEQLVEEKEIDPVPMEVASNSVNAYRLRPNQNLTALGFKVRAVFGFSPNDEMFAESGGGDVSHPVYGVVVMAGKEAVSDRIRETGSPATVKEVMPLVLSAVVCER
ncbi:hypothetical protein M3I53_22230 [Paraburkholderia sp. CNPSo 3272]|uniref:hypothetical protein n=1 Tax=Paraburkholderia sp. CNPSo 3272 TaxID=2940931 RepID=UPI0020B878B1|nr:hypothetical protein [Paraburkholderia sp. CNPSo 3272]MCP3725814.1 hypothetical protein [Paraburkholderia sp. CNPSo 3272]